MSYETITTEVTDGILTLTLNRPEMLNAFNQTMLSEMIAAFDEADADDDVRAIIVTGAGRGFCAGADFRYDQVRSGEIAPEVAEEPAGTEFDEGKIPHFFIKGLILGLQRLDKPTIAMVNGPAVGAGMDIALACDMRIGSENARFGMAFVKIGLIPGEGSTWTLPRIVGLGKAFELILTGDMIEAEEAYRIGLLNKLVPAARLEEETMALARRLAQGPPIAHRLDKLLIYDGMSTNLETALNLASACESIALRSEDHKEGILAFAQKRPPVFRGR